MLTKIKLFEYRELTLLDFFFVWMKSEVYKRKVATWDEFLARIMDADVLIKKREDQLRQTTRDLRTQVESALRLTVGFSNIYFEL
jgi:hypothetical protein